MRYLEVEGSRVSVVGLGAWQFGSREWGYGEDYAGREASAIVRRALDVGITLIDTAEIYAFGRSERIVGEAIAGRRDEVFVATKLFPVAPVAPVVARRARLSAKRLGVEAIDLYQVHWPNPVVPIGTTMNGLRTLLDDGLVRHAGVSNFSLDQWRRAEAALGRPVLSNQVRFSLVARRPADDLVGFAAERGRVVIAYSPLGQGLLSGRYDPATRPKGPMRSASPMFMPESLQRATRLLDALRDVARAHGVTPAQAALAWLLHHDNVVVIPGASSVAQVEANAAAADVRLGEDEFAGLREAAESFHPVSAATAARGLLRARLRR